MADPDDSDAADSDAPPWTLDAILRGDLLLVAATYVWQAVGVALLAASHFAGRRDAFMELFLGGALSFALGFTIRRCEAPDRWALPLTVVAGAVLGGLGALVGVASEVSAFAYAALIAVPLALIYHGAMIGEHVLTVTPYSGQRSAPVHGGCVRVVGYLAWVAITGFVFWHALAQL